MVAHVLRLRAAILLGALRGESRARSIGLLLLLIVGVASACWAVSTLGGLSEHAAFVVTVLGGAAVSVGALLAPPLAGIVDQLDPRRFVTLGLSPRPLAGAILAASILSMPMLALIAVSVSLAVMWVQRGAGFAGVAGALLGFLTCMLLARVGGALASMLGGFRRSRELTGLFLLSLFVIFVPVGVFFASLDWGENIPSPLAAAADVLALTPFGAPWAIAGGATGTAAPLAIVIVIALATVALLTWAWFALVNRALTTIPRPIAARERGSMGWFAVTPGTPAGAIAARSLTYWLRDRRYGVNILIVPIAALVATIPLVIAGVPTEFVALVPVPLIALFFGWLPHNDLAYDSTAVWMHIASGVRGISDRIGRLVPILLIGIPTFAVAIPLSIAMNGRWAHVPGLIGVTASIFLVGLGLSSISSVLAPYAVSRPGDSPFQQPQRTGGAGLAGQAIVLLGALVLSAPALWFGWLSVSSNPEYGFTALAVGIATGILVLGAGLALGGLAFERRSSQLMEFVEASY